MAGDTPNVSISIKGDAGGQISVGDDNRLTQTVAPTIDLTDGAAERVAEVRASTIFLSHAHADAELVAPIVRLLRLGADLSRSDIFCSSMPGSGVPAGSRWLDVLADELDGCQLVVIVITPAYLESTFCMCELGALWIKRIPNVPLVVPPLGPEDLSGILGQTQVLSLDDPVALDQLGERAAAAAGTQLSPADWQSERDALMGRLPELIAAAPGT